MKQRDFGHENFEILHNFNDMPQAGNKSVGANISDERKNQKNQIHSTKVMVGE